MNEELENENMILLKGIQKLTEKGKVFAFLNDEENIYSEADIKEKFANSASIPLVADNPIANDKG